MLKTGDTDFQMFSLTPPVYFHTNSTPLAAVPVQCTIVSSCSQERELTETEYSWLWLAVNAGHCFPSTPAAEESGYMC